MIGMLTICLLLLLLLLLTSSCAPSTLPPIMFLSPLLRLLLLHLDTAGTIFLWIMWPSFNVALTTDGQRLRGIANTFVSLCGAVIAAFFVSVWTKKKLDMVHIQNSTLAGGVAIGES
jgi:hypothetical protein